MPNDFYSHFGFNSNPFENNTAEREPHIASYAVRPPYLDRVLATSHAMGIFVLTGSRGSGKSATRLTVSQLLWKDCPTPLVVPLIGYNVFRPYAVAGAPLELYATQIAFLAIEQVLGWLSSLEDADSSQRLDALSAPERALIRKMIGTFYLNRPENARRVSAAECFATLDVSIQQKSRLWIDKKWDQLTGVVANLAAKFAERYFEVDLGDPAAYQELFKRQRAEGFGDPSYIFSKVVEFARAFGFAGVLVQVDKVDETDWTANSTEAAAKLIYPLLANIQLHEIEGLTWAYFLWDKVRDALSPERGFPVRWDKIPNGEIAWSDDYLRQLIGRRLRYFSTERHSSLQDICEATVNAEAIVPGLFELAERSPRNLISLLDITVSQHIQSNQTDYRLLSAASFDRGMDEYARTSLSNSGQIAIATQIAKVKATTFTTRDVASRFGISPQAARGRIENWQGSGLVEYLESKVGPDGGRPVDYFSIGDPRLQRFIERAL